MTSPRDETLVDSRNPVFESIAAGRRRRVLDTLLRWRPPLSEKRLAIHIAATERGTPSPDRTAIRGIQTELTHVHLPVLDDAGFVAWDRDDGTVERTTHPAFEDPRFRQLLETEIEGLDDALSGLAHERRRLALTILEDEGSTSLTALARDVLRCETGQTDLDSAAVDDVIGSLWHAHLPKLADADLVEYDAETRRVSYAGHPALEEVFTIIYEPDERIVDSFDGFFEGLEAAYRQLDEELSEEADWPHFWRDPHHG